MSKIIRLLKRLYYRITTFTIVRNYNTSKEVDDWFVEQLKNPKFEFKTNLDKVAFERGFKPYTIVFNGRRIWVRNKYYASPVIEHIPEQLPNMDTTVKFFKEYNKFLESQKIPLKELLKEL